MRSAALAFALAVAGALACGEGCKNDVPAVPETQDTPHLPPADFTGKGSAGSGLPPVNAGLPPVAVGSGGLPPVGSGSASIVAPTPTPMPTPTPTAGSSSGSGGSGSSGGAPAPATGSAPIATAGSGSAPAPATGSGSSSGSGSDTRTGGSVATNAPTSDCDVTIGITDTTATWSGGASGSAPVTGGHLGRLTEAVKPLDDMACRIVLRADADIRYDAVIAVLEAAYAARPFKMSIITPDGGRLNASPPTSGAAGTAVRDATPIVIDKKGIKVGATVAAALDDADIPSKVSAGLSAAQQVGTRGIMVTLKADAAMHYKLFGSVLTGVKSSGFVTVLFQ